MNAVTYSDLRKNLKSYMDKVYNNHEPLIITRKKSKNVVMVSIDEYNSIMETAYLMASEKNAEHIRKSLKELNEGKFKKRKLIDA